MRNSADLGPYSRTFPRTLFALFGVRACGLLVCWLVCWFIGLLVYWSIGWLVGWLVGGAASREATLLMKAFRACAASHSLASFAVKHLQGYLAHKKQPPPPRASKGP